MLRATWTILTRVVMLLATLALLESVAHADRVDDLIRQLGDRSDYKVRLSAALNLGKIGDRRAVPALTQRLRDPQKTVRGVAAAALGRLVNGSVEARVRNAAIAELERVSRGDSDNFVRSQAKKALGAVARYRDSGGGGGGGGGGGSMPTGIDVYIQVGKMSDNTKKGGKALLPSMRSTVEKTISRKAPSFLVRWPSGRAPSKSDLSKAGTKAAFYVDGSVTSLNIKKAGSSAEIECNVSLVIATYPDKSMFGFLKGGAAVETGSSDRAIDEGKSDCVGAVLEDLVSRQVVPTIKQRIP